MAGVWDKTNCFVGKLLNFSRKIDKNGDFHEPNFSKNFQKLHKRVPPVVLIFFNLPGNLGR